MSVSVQGVVRKKASFPLARIKPSQTTEKESNLAGRLRRGISPPSHHITRRVVATLQHRVDDGIDKCHFKSHT